MISSILGEKYAQNQKFDENGRRFPATTIKAGPCVVVQVKTYQKDGYNSVQLGFGLKKEKNIKKPQIGHIKKAGITKTFPRFLKEVKTDDKEALKIGDLISIKDVFKIGDKIEVTGTSKGKGFAGVVKRWHFKGGPHTHGQSDRERAPGAIGSTTTPGRVLKGKKMAGHLGSSKVTVKNLKVVDIDAEKNLLTVSGLVPGPKKGFLIIKKSLI